MKVCLWVFKSLTWGRAGTLARALLFWPISVPLIWFLGQLNDLRFLGQLNELSLLPLLWEFFPLYPSFTLSPKAIFSLGFIKRVNKTNQNRNNNNFDPLIDFPSYSNENNWWTKPTYWWCICNSCDWKCESSICKRKCQFNSNNSWWTDLSFAAPLCCPFMLLNKLLKDGVTKRCLQWIVDIIHQFTATVHQEKRLGELIILCMNNNINLSTTNLSWENCLSLSPSQSFKGSLV